MSDRVYDNKGRWRNKTIAFRVSPEEHASIDMRARMSGLTKQEYLCRRCQQTEVVVMKNPRVYKALKDQLLKVYEELKRIQDSTEIDDSLMEVIQIIAMTLNGMAGEESNDEKLHS